MKKPYTIINESCLDALDKMEENSIDAIVTDPPYEIGFMSKNWDNTGIAFSVDTWKKALRVLKPGGHLLAFNHSRTFHRMAVAIEDAGFQIRDTIMWLYGSGFPKSHNISKAIDKKIGFKGKIIGKAKGAGSTGKNSVNNSTFISSKQDDNNEYNIIELSEQAKQWENWGTALKPGYEPIIMARKPIEKSVADNVLKYGVGGINIDECRVGDELMEAQESGKTSRAYQSEETTTAGGKGQDHIGRFPANIIHDGSEEVISNFPETTSSGGSFKANDYVERKTSTPFTRGNFVGRNDSGSAARFFYTAKASKKDRNEGLDEFEEKTRDTIKNKSLFCIKCGKRKDYNCVCNVGFEYKQQQGYSQKTKNIHPTVKPTDLMQYLVRLVAPKGSKILDLFMGSGSTGKAAMLENVERNANYYFIGIDLEKEYCDIAEARINWAINYKDIEIEQSEKRVVNGKKAKQISIFDMKLEDIL